MRERESVCVGWQRSRTLACQNPASSYGFGCGRGGSLFRDFFVPWPSWPSWPSWSPRLCLLASEQQCLFPQRQWKCVLLADGASGPCTAHRAHAKHLRHASNGMRRTQGHRRYLRLRHRSIVSCATVNCVCDPGMVLRDGPTYPTHKHVMGWPADESYSTATVSAAACECLEPGIPSVPAGGACVHFPHALAPCPVEPASLSMSYTDAVPRHTPPSLHSYVPATRQAPPGRCTGPWQPDALHFCWPSFSFSCAPVDLFDIRPPSPVQSATPTISPSPSICPSLYLPSASCPCSLLSAFCSLPSVHRSLLSTLYPPLCPPSQQ